MIAWIHPSFFLFLGAILLPFVRERRRSLILLGAPSLAFVTLLLSPEGYAHTTIMDMPIILGRIDRLSRIFGYIFTTITLIGMIYALHQQDIKESIAALLYAGSALGAVFAGDFLTLFIFWEIMAFTSTFLILLGGKASASFRYILVHIAGGVCLLAGILIHVANGHPLTFTSLLSPGQGTLALGPTLILIGFLVNAAAPPIHAWLADAYPEASTTGIVFLSAFTTKTAVYVLIRGFAGFTPLALFGAFMALYGVIYAMMENNIRRLLAYHIISQVGFMVAGVGIGTEMAINGAVAHAVTHILYKALLMMGMSSVLFMTKEKHADRLGGLARVMPLTFFFYMIGGLSISGVPPFSGFVSKSITISAASGAHMTLIYIFMLLASCGTFLSTTLKLPYAVFIGEDKHFTVTDPPRNMLIGMGGAAFLCLFIGVFPNMLYRLLPYSIPYHPYTLAHLTGALQLLCATAILFLLALPRLHPHATLSLDTDWFYRKGAALFVRFTRGPLAAYEAYVTTFYQHGIIQPMKRIVSAFLTFDREVIDGIVNSMETAAVQGGKLSNFLEKYVIYGFINITGFSNHLGARLFRRLQTGSVHNYAITMIFGIFLLVNLYFLLR